MLDYAAMLFKNQEVHFTILHIKSPCQKESCSGKCQIIFDAKLQKSKTLLENVGNGGIHVETKFIEGSFIESIRHVIAEQKTDLIILGNSSGDTSDTGLFFDKKTLEIITKIKCPVILVPEKASLKLPKTALLPTDFSITSDYSIFNILTSLNFISKTHLALLPTGTNEVLGPNKTQSKALISKVINSLKFKSVREIPSTSKLTNINGYDLIMVMAKNLSIFQNLFSTSPASLCRAEVPILFLHDSRKF